MTRLWSGRWIWPVAPEVEFRLTGDHGIREATRDRVFYLRRRFDLEAVPPRVPCRVSADSRFVLYVNGTEVTRGPARAVPHRLTWRECDLAAHLRPGANVVAALVRFYGRAVAWWLPAHPCGQLGYGAFLLEAPSIGVCSDRTWRGSLAPYRPAAVSDPFYPPIEILDGRQVPTGWTLPDFDDGDWEPVAELRGEWLTDIERIPGTPYSAMEPDDIAALTATPLRLVQIGAVMVGGDPADDPVAAYRRAARQVAATVWDAGRITLATPAVVVQGVPGALVDLYAGEDLDADGAVVIEPRGWALRYVLAGHGEERVEAFDAVGFRYLCVAPRGEVRVRAVDAVERRYPRAPGAWFRCDDQRLTRLWELGARTLDLCSTDAFIDCPGREQRAWVGDTYIHTLVSLVTNPDQRLVRRSLRVAAQAIRPDGLLPMVAAGDLARAPVTIPDYSLHWVRALARYHDYSGDTATVAELLPVALGVLDAFERWRGPDGLLRGVPGWIFIDWAQIGRDEIVGALNALHAAALADLAKLLADVDPGSVRVREIEGRAHLTRQAFELLWDDRRGVYVDAAGPAGLTRRVSQHTNAAAIVGGCAPPHRFAAILDRILDPARVRITATPADFAERQPRSQWLAPPDFDDEEHVVGAQPFFSHFLHQAVAAAGRRGLITALCRRWLPQLERGNTAVEEYWDAPPGRASRAHAWAATPTYDLTTHVLGVRPLTPGFGLTGIHPHLGDLTRLHGRVPTPHGWIEIELTRHDALIEIPRGVSAVVTFDDVKLPSGDLGPGRHHLGEGDAQ